MRQSTVLRETSREGCSKSRAVGPGASLAPLLVCARMSHRWPGLCVCIYIYICSHIYIHIRACRASCLVWAGKSVSPSVVHQSALRPPNSLARRLERLLIAIMDGRWVYALTRAVRGGRTCSIYVVCVSGRVNGIDVRPCMACGPANLCASICVLQERRRGHRDEELGFRLFFWGGGREELSSFSKSAKQRERERERIRKERR